MNNEIKMRMHVPMAVKLLLGRIKGFYNYED